MFGYVEGDNGKDTNLAPWKENFTDGELTGSDLQTGQIWSNDGSSDFTKPLGSGDSEKYLKHNGVT